MLEPPRPDNPPGGPLTKALALLEVLARSRGPVGPGELSRRSGQPRSSVHRVLAVLLDLRLVVSVGGGYALGDRLFEFALDGTATRADHLRRALNPFLVDLQERTGGIAVLGVLRGGDVHYVEVLHSYKHAAFVRRIGATAPDHLTMPAHRTSAGRALLAHRPDLVAGFLADDRALAEALRAVRARGVATVEHEGVHGGVGAAAAIHLGAEPPFAALGVVHPDLVDISRTAVLVRRAAEVAGAAVATGLRPVRHA